MFFFTDRELGEHVGPYLYDLVDVTRQCLENFFFDLYQQVEVLL